MSVRSWLAKVFGPHRKSEEPSPINREELLRAELDTESAAVELDAIEQSWPPGPH